MSPLPPSTVYTRTAYLLAPLIFAHAAVIFLAPLCVIFCPSRRDAISFPIGIGALLSQSPSSYAPTAAMDPRSSLSLQQDDIVDDEALLLMGLSRRGRTSWPSTLTGRLQVLLPAD
jgi:hypothetical protein